MWWFTAYFLYGSGTAQCNWRRRTLYGNGRSADCTKYAYNDNQVSREKCHLGHLLWSTFCKHSAMQSFKYRVAHNWIILLSFSLTHSAMSTNRSREELGPMTRNRSSSANEASKPVLVMQRRQTHGSKTLNFSPSNSGSVAGKFFHTIQFIYSFIQLHSFRLVGNKHVENQSRLFLSSRFIKKLLWIPIHIKRKLYAQKLTHMNTHTHHLVKSKQDTKLHTPNIYLSSLLRFLFRLPFCFLIFVSFYLFIWSCQRDHL